MSNMQNHHLAPQELLPGGKTPHKVFVDLNAAGISVSGNSPAWNLQALPTSSGYIWQPHNGSHGGYTKWYATQLTVLDSRYGSDPVALANAVKGLNNVIKIKFADPEFDVKITGYGGLDAETKAENAWNAALNIGDFIDPDGNTDLTHEAFKLGLEGGSISVAVRGEWGSLVPADASTNSFRYETTDANLQKQKVIATLQEIEKINEFLAENSLNGQDNTHMIADAFRKGVEHANGLGPPLEVITHFDKSGSKSYVSLKTVGIGTGATVGVVFGTSALADVTSAVGKISDGGSAIVDGGSILLLGYAFKESGLIDDLTVKDTIALLNNSNVRHLVTSNLDNLAVEIGKEVAVGGVATLLGVGLLWKAFEVYQSIDGLVGALDVAARFSDDEWIANLKSRVDGVKDWLDSKFASGGTAQPEWSELGDVIEENFDITTQRKIGAIIKEYLISESDPDAYLYSDSEIKNLLAALDYYAQEDGVSIESKLRSAILSSDELSPQEKVALDPTNCFPAGTKIKMWNGGEKNIEDVRPSDIVLAFNDQGEPVPGEVARTFQNIAPRLVRLTDDLGRVVLHVTPGHKFFTQTGDYLEIGDMLRLGRGSVTVVSDYGDFIRLDGELINFDSEERVLFEEIKLVSGQSRTYNFEGGWKTYNFEVVDYHNYVAERIRVHNDSILSLLTPEERSNVVRYETDENGKASFVVAKVFRGNIEAETSVRALDGSTKEGIVESTVSDGNGNVYYKRVRRDSDGKEVVETGGQNGYEPLAGQFVGEQLGRSLTPFITSAFLDDDASPFERVLADTFIGTVMENFAGSIGGFISRVDKDFGDFDGNQQFKDITKGVFEDFGGELVVNGVNATISVANQLFLVELFGESEVDGVGDAVLRGLASASFNSLAKTVAGNFLQLDGVQDFFTSLGVKNAASLAGNFGIVNEANDVFKVGDAANPLGFDPLSVVFTAVLGEILPAIETREGAVASAVTGALLSTITSAKAWIANLGTLGGPISFVITWVVGKLFDKIFAKEPEAYGMVDFDESVGRFVLVGVTENDGGDLEFAEGLATAYVNGMNSVIDSLQSQSHNFGDGAGTGTLRFGHDEDNVVTQITKWAETTNTNYHDEADPNQVIRYLDVDTVKSTNFANAQDAYLSYTLDQLENIHVRDGNAVAMEIFRSLDIAEMREQLGDDEAVLMQVMSRLQLADDYLKYLESEETVEAWMIANPDSVFAAGWQVTLLNIQQLGLDQDYNLTGDAVDNVFLTAQGNDRVQGSTNDDLIKTYSGNDTLEGGLGNDTLVGGRGDDFLYGGKGSDTYVLTSLYSNAVVRDQNVTAEDASDTDTLRLSSTFLVQDMTFAREGDSFNFTWNEGTGSEGSLDSEHIENVEFMLNDPGKLEQDSISVEVNNITWSWYGQEIAMGSNGNDYLQMGATSDKVTFRKYEGRRGDDLYIYSKDMRNVEILGETATGGNDRVVITDLAYADATVELTGGFLQISWGTAADGGMLRIADNGANIEGVEFAAAKLADYEAGTKASPAILLSSFADLSNGATDGSDGHDILNGSSSADTVSGNDGNDTIYGAGGSDLISGGLGDDVLMAGSTGYNNWGYDTISGGLGNDSIVGSKGKDWIFGDLNFRDDANGDSTLEELGENEGGNDTLFGGDDGSTSRTTHIFGGGGDDLIYSGQTTALTAASQGSGDYLSGGAGNDTLIGGLADDSLRGGLGSDDLNGGAGADDLNGGAGQDRAVYKDALEGVKADLTTSAENNLNTGEASGDTYAGIRNILGSSFGDTILGNHYSNRLEGGDGDDELYGRSGDDILFVGKGTGDGWQRMEGGSGSDIYVVSADSGNVITEDETSGEGVNNRIVFDGIGVEDVTFNGESDFLKIEWETDEGSGEYRLAEEGNNIRYYEFKNEVIYHKFQVDFDSNGHTRAVGTNGVDYLATISSENVITFGDDGNDTIIGGKGVDTIDGGDGNDVLNAGSGHNNWEMELLEGGDGDDVYEIGEDAQLVGIGADLGSGTAFGYMNSDDVSKVSNGTDTLRFIDKDFGELHFEEVNYASSGSNALSSDWGTAIEISWNNVSYGETEATSRKIVIANHDIGEVVESYEFQSGVAVEKIISGTYADETLNGDGSSSLIYGGDGDDVIWGTGGDELLIGGSGKDKLNGRAGNDTLDAGEGTGSWQYLKGHSGDDTYIYSKDGGKVFIEDSEGTDVVYFEDLELADVKMEIIQDYGDHRWGRALSITWEDEVILEGDDIPTIIQGELRVSVDGSDIEKFVFSDGSTIGGVLADFTTYGRDKITGTSGDDLIVGTNGSEYIYGGEGNDTIDAGGATIVEATGAPAFQYLYGEKGDDLYSYSTNSGFVLIGENPDDAIWGLNDKVKFTDLSLQDIEFSFHNYQNTQWGDAIIAEWEKKDDAGLVEERGKVVITHKGEGIEEFEFADGGLLSEIEADFKFSHDENPDFELNVNEERDRLNGTAGDDLIVGTATSDFIYGLDGNDTLDAGLGTAAWQQLVGGDGDDTYIYSKNNGRVYIGEYFGNDARGIADRIEFTDLNFGDLTTVEIDSSNKLILRWDDGVSSGTLKIYGEGKAIEEFVFADKSVYEWHDLL